MNYYLLDARQDNSFYQVGFSLLGSPTPNSSPHRFYISLKSFQPDKKVKNGRLLGEYWKIYEEMCCSTSVLEVCCLVMGRALKI